MGTIKISELTPSQTLKGFSTIGTDADNKSVQVSLSFIADEADRAAAAAETATAAAETATTAAETANTAAAAAATQSVAAAELNAGVRTEEQVRAAAETSRAQAETTRESNEATRQTAEATREDNETARKENETTRQTAEATREDNETARVQAETQRATDWTAFFSDTVATGVRYLWNSFWPSCKETWETWFGTSAAAGVQGEWATLKADVMTATASANDATAAAQQATEDATAATDNANAATVDATAAATAADLSAAEALNVPKIEDGYFWTWDTETKAYVKTTALATGQSPKIIDGTWWTYDDAAGAYADTGQSVNTDYQLTKEKVEGVLTGDITTHTHDHLRYAAQVYEETPAFETLTSWTDTLGTHTFLAGNDIYVKDATEATGYANYKLAQTAAGTAWVRVPQVADGWKIVMVKQQNTDNNNE